MNEECVVCQVTLPSPGEGKTCGPECTAIEAAAVKVIAENGGDTSSDERLKAVIQKSFEKHELNPIITPEDWPNYLDLVKWRVEEIQ